MAIKNIILLTLLIAYHVVLSQKKISIGIGNYSPLGLNVKSNFNINLLFKNSMVVGNSKKSQIGIFFNLQNMKSNSNDNYIKFDNSFIIVNNLLHIGGGIEFNRKIDFIKISNKNIFSYGIQIGLEKFQINSSPNLVNIISPYLTNSIIITLIDKKKYSIDIENSLKVGYYYTEKFNELYIPYSISIIFNLKYGENDKFGFNFGKIFSQLF